MIKVIIEVAQGGVSSKQLIMNSKKIQNNNSIKKFSADASILKKNVFAPENRTKLSSKNVHNLPPFYFSIANRPKNRPNLIFCFIKMSPCATSI